MNSAASPTVRDPFTPDDAAVLCLICTGSATGSRLVATLTVRPEFTLAEVRHVLERLARTGDGGDLMVRDAPTNVTESQAAAILEAPLHPLDLTAPFSFVHSGGCRVFSRKQEQILTCAAVFPRFPRLGVPKEDVSRCWSMSPPAPLVVVPYFPPASRLAAGGPGSPNTAASPTATTPHAHTAVPASLLTEAQTAQAQKRLAAAVLFVAQGEPHHVQTEHAMAERLLLSQQLGAGSTSSSSSSTTTMAITTAAGASAQRRAGGAAAGSTFGQRFSLSAWSSAVTRWNANLRDYTGRTTLQEAAAAGNDVAVKFLLSQSYVVVDAQTTSGNTALHMAIRGNHAQVVKLLVEDGAADVLLANAQGNTPLHVALLEQRAGLVALLCQHLRTRGRRGGSGDDVTLKDLAACRNRDGYSPIQLFEKCSPSVMELAQEGRLVPLKALVHHFLFVRRHLQSRDVLTHGTILHAAASSGHVELLRFLCEELEVFPDGCREAQLSPVDLAAMASSSSSGSPSSATASPLLRWMLDGRYQTPLHAATVRGHLDCARYLAGRYSQWLSVPDLNGDTPLILAIKYRQFHVAEFFLLQCAPGTVAANVCDHRGLTALHYVCGLGMAPAAEALMTQHGAKANANADRLALGSVCRPLNNNSRVWGPHQRNRLLVSAGATIELSSAKRAEARRAGRRSTAVAKTSGASPSAGAATASPYTMGVSLSSSGSASRAPRVERSCECGGGLRGSTPLLCALAAGRVLNVRDVIRVLCRFGAIDNKDDACDLFFYLLTHGEERLASEIVQSSQDDGLVRSVSADNSLLLRLCEARVERGIRWCVENRCGAFDRPARVALSGGISHPLVMSVAAGDLGAVRYLITRGADVSVPATSSSTPAAANNGSRNDPDSNPMPTNNTGTLTAQSHPLLTAILYHQEEVARVLVQSGARLSSGDGSWCALQAAALFGLESVVHGLLGHPALSGYDVAQSLVAVLQKTWASVTTTTTTTTRAAYTDRWQSRATAPRIAQEQRIAVALAEHYDPTASEVHPVELLHLSAARGFFAVTRALLCRLARLPATLRVELVRTMPAAPARVWKLIEPTMAPAAGDMSRFTRLLPNAASGKGGLYRLRKPFERLVLPNWRRLPQTDTVVLGSGTALMRESRFLHRVHGRDVYSYAAAANDATLIRQLREVLPEMLPWSGPDMSGWTAMDYALHVPDVSGPAPELVCVLLLSGVSPRCRHGRRVLPTRAALLSRAVQTLVPWNTTATATSSPSHKDNRWRSSSSTAAKLVRAHCDGEGQLSHVLCALLRRGPGDIALNAPSSPGSDANKGRAGFTRHADLWTLQMIRGLLEKYREGMAEAESVRATMRNVARDNAAEGEADRQGAPSRSPSAPLQDEGECVPKSSSSLTASASTWIWLRPVVATAIQYAHLDVLVLLQEVLSCPYHLLAGAVQPASPSSPSTSPGATPLVVPSPLLAAVALGDEEVVAFLLRAGCSAYEMSPMTLEMARLIPLKHAESFTITPLCYAAWMGRVDLLLQLVGGSVVEVTTATTAGTYATGAHKLKPEQCADEGAQLGDALKALFHTTSLARCRRSQAASLVDVLMAKAVRALAGTGHPYLSPLVLRTALARGLRECVHALIQCYGPAAVEVDLIPEEINSLHYLAASPQLVPLLRSLLVTTTSLSTTTTPASGATVPAAPRRTVGLEVASWTPLAQTLQSADFRRAPLDPVDYALVHGCADGALLLMAAGWTGGSGRIAATHTSRTRQRGGRHARSTDNLVSRVAAVLQHFQLHRWLYATAGEMMAASPSSSAGGGYTVLHSAVALGYDDVVKGLVAHMCALPRNAYAQHSGQPRFLSAMEVMGQQRQAEHPHWRRRRIDAEESDADAEEPSHSQTPKAAPPSVYVLAALHERGAHYLPLLEEVARREQWLRPRDVVYFFFNASFRVSRVTDALCRQAINAAVYGQVFSLLPDRVHDQVTAESPSSSPSMEAAAHQKRGRAVQDTPYAAFFAKLYQERPAALLFHAVAARASRRAAPAAPSLTSSTAGARGGSGVWALTACTALTAAIASGRLEWVQYMAFCDPSMRQHRATLSYCDTVGRRGCGNRAPLPPAPLRRQPSRSQSRRRGRGTGRRVPRPHRCDPYAQWPRMLQLSGPTIGLDALVLSVLYIAQAFHARDEVRRQQYVDIFSFLLSLPGALTRSNVNVVAMSLAAMREWALLSLLLSRADQFRRFLTSRVPASTQRDADAEGDGGLEKTDATHASQSRYFTALLDNEIPVVLHGLLGAARHAIHLVAHCAPKEVMIEVARRSQRVDVESCVDADGRTALFHALHHQNTTECGVACFAALRVPFHAVCCHRTGRTPLMVAACEGRLHLITTLLQSSKVRALIDDADRRGYTPLMLAAANGHADVVEVLLAADAKPSQQTRDGRTAVMLAAENGHDAVALPLAQHFSKTRDLVSAQTTVLHAAARGHAVRTLEAVLKQLADPVSAVLQLDSDGHSALYVAHAFGCGPAVRAFLGVVFQPRADRHATVQSWASQSLATVHAEEDARDRALMDELSTSNPWFAHVCALYEMGDENVRNRHRPGPAWQRLGTGAVLSPDATDTRLYLCDPRLTTYGWWRRVLEVNAVLALEAAANVAESASASSLVLDSSRTALRLCPGEKVIAPQTPPFRGHLRGPRGDSLTYLVWCAQTNNAVGVRVLADHNVSDADGLALRWAAKYGHMDVVKLLVQLQMSDPALRGAQDGLYAFEVAARHQHKMCALYLLAQTHVPWPSEWLPALPPLDKKSSGDAVEVDGDMSDLCVHTVFHRLAPVCDGEVLVAFVEQLLSHASPSTATAARTAAKGTALMCARLWAELQRPDEAGLTPFEYTVARGNAASVLRTAQIMQQLSDTAQGIPVDASGAHVVGYHGGSEGQSRTDAVSISSALLQYLPTLSPAVRTLLFDFFALQDVCHTVGFRAAGSEPAPPSKTTAGRARARRPPPTTDRLRFGDVRLLGIAALRQQELFRGVLASVYTVDHERQVLRGQLYEFPLRIRYEPESFRQCTLAEQIALLQWLSSSLLLDAYEGISAEEVETIEVHVVKHRSHEFLEGIGTLNVSHSLYISSNQYVSLPDVKDAVWSAVQATRADFCRTARHAARQATKVLRSLPHPALRRGDVSVEWPLQTHERNTAPWTGTTAANVSGSPFWTALEDSRTWLPIVQALCGAMDDLAVYLRGEVSTVLSAVRQENDIAAVVGRGDARRRASTTATTSTNSQAADEGTLEDSIPAYHIVFRYMADGDVAALAAVKAQHEIHAPASRTCVIAFNESGMAPLKDTLDTTLLRALRADVCLVGIHYARSRFVKSIRSAMQTAMEEDARGQARGHRLPSAPASSSATAPVPAPLNAPAVQFKLELEGSRVDCIPLPTLEAMLDAAVEATHVLLFTEAHDTHFFAQANGEGPLLSRYRATRLVRDGVLRRLRHVLVLFTTRREALVHFTDDKLMLCFGPQGGPNVSEIVDALKRATLEEEVATCQRVLPDVLTAMQEKLHALLPSARLIFDESSLTRAVSTTEEENPSVVRVTNLALQASAYRLLVASHSRFVLQPLIEGLTMGWDTAIGAVARQELREVHVRMETAEGGSCYLSPDGARLVYYCPLHCVQYGTVAQPFGGWQLLTATQVASLYVMQLLARHRGLTKVVDREKAVACWTSVMPLCVARVAAGATVQLWLRGRNLLNQPVHRGGESFTFVGRGVSATSVHVFERKRKATATSTGHGRKARSTSAGRGDGRYLVRFTAPLRAGEERLHILLHGQPIAASPLRLRIDSGPVDLAQTQLVVPHNTALVRRPFKVRLILHDAHGNRLTRIPKDLSVQLPHEYADRDDVSVLSWQQEGLSCLSVQVVVRVDKPALTLALELSIPEPNASPAGADGVYFSPTTTAAAAGSLSPTYRTHVCVSEQNALSVVTRDHLDEIFALLSGQTLDSVPDRQHKRRVRQRARRRHRREAAKRREQQNAAAQRFSGAGLPPPPASTSNGSSAPLQQPSQLKKQTRHTSSRRRAAPPTGQFSPGGRPCLMKMSDREKLYFRKSIRQSEKRRLKREAEGIVGGIVGRTFPPDLVRDFL